MRYLIDFKNDTTQESIDLFFTENNIQVIKNFNAFDKVYLVSTDQIIPFEDIIESITNDDSSTIVPLEFNVDLTTYTYTESTIRLNDDKDWWKNYSIYNPSFDEEEYTLPRKGIRSLIYLLDSGIKVDHPEFQNCNIENLWTFNDSFDDVSGHGTALASVMIGNTCGLTSAKVLNVRIFDPQTPTKQSDILGALDAVYQHYMDHQTLVPIINCSWSISKNSYIEQKFQFLINQGFYVVAAAGNSGTAVENVTPASMKDVITIGSYGPELKPSSFSNYSNPSVVENTQGDVNTGELDGWAPGEKIWVASLNGEHNYANGTSFSCAIVSSSLAYNNDNYCFENSALSSLWKQIGKKIMLRTLSRKNLLILTDQYKLSNSLICTFDNAIATEVPIEPYYSFVLDKSFGPSTLFQRFFIEGNIKSLIFDNELPSYFGITPTGYISIDKTKAIPNDSSFQNLKFNFILTDIDDVTSTGLIELFILGEQTNREEILLNNPTLDPKQLGITYFCQSGFQGGGQLCVGLAYQGDWCFDDCAYYNNWALCNNSYCKGVYVGVGNEEPFDCYCS